MKSIYTVKLKRKANGKTDYKKRLTLLLAEKPRLVIRRSVNNIMAQLVTYEPDGDKIIATMHSSSLKKLGWKHSTGNIPAAYLTGLALGKKLKGSVKEAILDIGLQKSVKGSRIYSCLKGVIDSGISIPHDAEILPNIKRISGEHISADIKKSFEEIKSKI